MIRHKSAVTLVEVCIATAILVMTVGSFLSIILMSVKSSKTSDYMYIAANMGKNRIERLKELDFQSLEEAEETDTRLDKYGNSNLTGDFFRTTHIAGNYEGSVDLKEVTVTIDYIIMGERTDYPVIFKTVFVNPE